MSLDDDWEILQTPSYQPLKRLWFSLQFLQIFTSDNSEEKIQMFFSFLLSKDLIKRSWQNIYGILFWTSFSRSRHFLRNFESKNLYQSNSSTKVIIQIEKHFKQ